MRELVLVCDSYLVSLFGFEQIHECHVLLFFCSESKQDELGRPRKQGDRGILHLDMSQFQSNLQHHLAFLSWSFTAGSATVIRASIPAPRRAPCQICRSSRTSGDTTVSKMVVSTSKLDPRASPLYERVIGFGQDLAPRF